MPGPLSLPQLEEEVLKRWKSERIFEQTLEQTKGKPHFVFYEGPPYANGQPGVHHMLSRAYKDAIVRYKTMRGFHVGRRAGWDTHGLPVEMFVEKQLGIKSKREIEEVIGVQKFIDECRKNVFLMKSDWEAITERMGYWLDFENAYVTLTPEFIESCWWIFSEIEKKGRLYKDFKVVPLCTRCGTALSSHEMAQGYKKVEDSAVFVKFKVKSDKGQVKKGDYILSWTTTPWTLPGNVGLAVGEEVEYVLISIQNERFIVAKTLLEKIFGSQVTGTTFYGKDMLGVAYEPLFPGAIPESTPGYENAFKVYAADFVTIDDGTGVVHTAVMYGEDDYKLGEKVGLPKVHTVGRDGKFNELVPKWAGWPVKHKDKPTEEKTTRAIIDDLKERGLLYTEETYAHDYPFCWRCDTPLLYYAKDSWFFRTTDVKDKLIKMNQSINWVPAYIKEGRMGEWLENLQDWAISRERYWGIPLPIWLCDKDERHRTVIGGYEELQKRAATALSDPFDPHRPGIDAVTLSCDQCDGLMTRVLDVADVWFDSGSMPLAQWHYPFENTKLIDSGEQYPADFIAEGIDQTRGWFYTLLAVAALLDRKAPYKNVVSLGLVNDAEGKKMSKRLGNLILPTELFPKFGADAVRFYLYTMSQAGDFKNFDPKGVDEVVKKVFFILMNVVSFYELHAPSSVDDAPKGKHILDRWIFAKRNELVKNVTEELEAYDLTGAGRAIAEFVTDLSTWYLRRSRDRFREPGAERDQAGNILRVVLLDLAKLLAPFSPMIADVVYLKLQGGLASVHLEAWPKAQGGSEEKLLQSMTQLRRYVEAGHAARANAGVRVRQPLGEVVIKSSVLPDDVETVLKDELNVLLVRYAETLPSGAGWSIQDDGVIALALSTTLTEELREAGWVREIARHINDARKTLGVDRNDLVRIRWSAQGALADAIRKHSDELTSLGKARSMEYADSLENAREVEFDGQRFGLSVEKD